MANYCIKTSGLHLWYGAFRALEGVDFHARLGNITALIGPSGCGKSTLLRCFNRMNERYGNVRTSGEVLIQDTNIYEDSVDLIELRKRVGMVFQRPNPLPLSVRDNVLYGYRLHTLRRHSSSEDMEEVLESALRDVQLWDELKDVLDHKATDLQLEKQQKLCIARLLPLKPDVILMDEPCSALDPDSTKKVEELLRGLRGKYSIVIVTHNMAQARRVSDECAFMLLGVLIEHRRTEDLFVAPTDPRTADYIEGRFG
ncbi:MAG: phosphate ABC transporter ATP-binding protein [Candidatus Binatia bacterium]